MKWILQGLMVAAVTASAGGARAEDLTDIARAHTVDSLCYDMRLDLARLEDRHPYPRVTVPFCVNLSAQYDLDNIVCSPQACFLHPKSERFVTVKTATNFQALYEHSQYTLWPNTPPGADWHMVLRGSVYTNWDYRLNQVLAAVKDQLAVPLTTVLVPSMGEVEPLDFSMFSIAGQLNITGQWFRRMSAIAFDDQGREYQLDISFGLDPRNVTFQTPRAK